MKIAKTRIVFDRHNTATKTNKATVYVEVSYKRVRNFYNTGVSVYSDQFKNGRVVNHGQMVEMNRRINEMQTVIEEYINEKIKAKSEFSLDGLKKYMETRNSDTINSFLRFMLSKIMERPISESTRKGHLSVYRTLKKWGHITQFSDITDANIKLWDELARKNAVKQKSVYTYHKVLKIYIREAKTLGFISNNPYDSIRFPKDKSAGHRFITKDELQRIIDLPLFDKSLINARKCFLFQCYTGLSYSDLVRFDMANVKRDGGKFRIRAQRQKTGEEYNITLLKPAMRILEQCDYQLPVQEMHYYNRNLQAIQLHAGIPTRLTSHVARHTFATTIALKNKMPIEVLQRVLGHSSIKTTQIYAKVLQESVDEEFDRIDELL